MNLATLLVALVSAAEPAAAQPVVRLEDAPAYVIANGKGIAVLQQTAATGSPEASVGRLVLQPGAVVPEHEHADGSEYLVVLSGAAELTVDGQAWTLGPGDAVHLAKGRKHSAKVAADAKAPLVAVQVYTPAGAEQRFAKGAKAPAQKP
jgi:quercetin dioxygenase-like cupin family protein